MTLSAKIAPDLLDVKLLEAGSKQLLLTQDDIPPSFWAFRSCRMWLCIALAVMVTSISASKTALGGALICMNELGWSADEIALLFSVVSWSTLITGVPGGLITDRYGSRILSIIAVSIVSLSTLVFPIAVKLSYAAALISRIFLGIGAGLMMPCIMSMTSKWYGRLERTTAAAVWSSGHQAGTMLTYPLAAFFCGTPTTAWQCLFYTMVVLGGVAVIMMLACGSDSPDKHWRISDVERRFVTNATEEEHFTSRKMASSSIPWRHLFTSPAVLATLVNEYSSTLVSVTVASYLPSFYSHVLGLDNAETGSLCMLPFASMWVGKVLGTALSNKLISSRCVSPTIVCKIFQSIAMFLGSLFLMLGVSTTSWASVTFITLSMACLGLIIPGHMTSMTSLAPPYSGILSSLALVGNAFGGAIGPMIVGQFVVTGTQWEYQLAFGVICAQAVIAGVVFVVWGSTSVEEWARPPVNKLHILKHYAIQARNNAQKPMLS